jgi:hypothetical protein
MSEPRSGDLPNEISREFVEAANELLQLQHLAARQSFSKAETILLAKRRARVVDVLRRMMVDYGVVPAVKFRGLMFVLASHPLTLAVVPEDQVRSIDG